MLKSTVTFAAVRRGKPDGHGVSGKCQPGACVLALAPPAVPLGRSLGRTPSLSRLRSGELTQILEVEMVAWPRQANHIHLQSNPSPIPPIHLRSMEVPRAMFRLG